MYNVSSIVLLLLLIFESYIQTCFFFARRTRVHHIVFIVVNSFAEFLAIDTFKGRLNTHLFKSRFPD